MVVWAAGIKAPEFLKDLDGLETDRINRLVVRDTLQTTRDDNIFVVGDCACCVLPRRRQANAAARPDGTPDGVAGCEIGARPTQEPAAAEVSNIVISAIS